MLTLYRQHGSDDTSDELPDSIANAIRTLVEANRL
jgi:hypothetical protein